MSIKEAIAEIKNKFECSEKIWRDNEKLLITQATMKMWHNTILGILKRHEKDTCANCEYNDGTKRIGCEINWELQKVAENNKPIYCSECEAKKP